MYKEKQVRIWKNKININFLLEALYPYSLLASANSGKNIDET